MLNLLFISNSPKAQYIKSELQPLLRVIIDVVPDFDHGLKDVFERRPATVCIQDQIAGVTGESVARHIQMLLGAGAPSFILMHDGGSKVKPIKGLFEHVIDLNQPDAELSKNFRDLLQTLLGEQWLKIYIPPTQTAVPVDSSVSVPQQESDKLVDEFLQDLETETLPADVPNADFWPVPDTLAEDPVTQASIDEMADLLLARASQTQQDNISSDAPTDLIAEQDAVPIPPLETASTAVDSALIDSVPAAHRCHVKPVKEKMSGPRPLEPVSPTVLKVVEPESKVPTPGYSSASSVPEVTIHKDKLTSKPVVPVAPSEFKINQDKGLAEEPIPEDLLLAFEKNYRSKTTYMTRSLLVLLILLGVSGAGWYVFKQKNHLGASLKQRIPPIPLPAVKQSSTLVKPVQPEQKNMRVQVAPQNPATVLPPFIPQEGHDSSYAVSNPGWERYVGKNSEVRVFKSGTSVKAVQVLALKGNSLSDVFLKSVLKELAGSADYRINSRETKSGMLVLRGTIAQKADILIYKKSSLVRAFVVSLN